MKLIDEFLKECSLNKAGTTERRYEEETLKRFVEFLQSKLPGDKKIAEHYMLGENMSSEEITVAYARRFGAKWMKEQFENLTR